jgi:hypothetical protein
MHFFKSHRRNLGHIIYRGPDVGAWVRAETLALMNSLRVSGLVSP